MKHVSYILIGILILAIGCDKQGETGEVIFCTNSYLGNCAFLIEISVDGDIVGRLTAETGYSSMNCKCPEELTQGMIVDFETGEHTFTAKELNCAAANRTNTWSGIINVSSNNCETVILDIME